MMCRRLKHCDLGRSSRTELINCILNRLREGTFSEQFKDQLRLALHLNRQRTLQVCLEALASKKAHVARYGAWAIKLDQARAANAA